MEIGVRKSILLVIDSLGIGEQADASYFDSRGANTLAHIAESRPQGLKLPQLEALGLGNLTFTRGLERVQEPVGFHGRTRLRSFSNDSLSGHWEMAGLTLLEEFQSFPNGPSEELLHDLTRMAETEFIVFKNDDSVEQDELLRQYFVEHQLTEKPVLFCSGNSRLRISIHPDVMPIRQQALFAERIRIIADMHNIASIVVLPFGGDVRNISFDNENKKELYLKPVQPTILDMLQKKKIPVHGIGRIPSLFANGTIDYAYRAESNEEVVAKVVDLIRDSEVNDQGQAFIFANLYDFDNLYAHTRNPEGYAKALEIFDSQLSRIERTMENEDFLYLTSDHGCDPTFPGTGHTREHVPLIVYSRMIRPQKGSSLGTRKTLADIAQTISEAYDLGATYAADSFWEEMVAHM